MSFFSHGIHIKDNLKSHLNYFSNVTSLHSSRNRPLIGHRRGGQRLGHCGGGQGGTLPGASYHRGALYIAIQFSFSSFFELFFDYLSRFL